MSSVSQTVVSRLNRSVSFDNSKSFSIHHHHHHQTSAESAANCNAERRTRGVFDSEVWVWGKGESGQLGQGDLLDRLQPCPIARLNRSGVVKVVSGDCHAVALTVTGRVLAWGDSSSGQVECCIFPQNLVLPPGETARDIGASGSSTLVLCDSGRLYFCKISQGDFSPLLPLGHLLMCATRRSQILPVPFAELPVPGFWDNMYLYFIHFLYKNTLLTLRGLFMRLRGLTQSQKAHFPFLKMKLKK